jgi:hypothetical protein
LRLNDRINASETSLVESCQRQSMNPADEFYCLDVSGALTEYAAK